MQILIAILTTDTQVVIPQNELGMGIGDGVGELHLAAGIGVSLLLQIAAGRAEIILAIMSQRIVGALVSIKAIFRLGSQRIAGRAIPILQTTTGFQIEAVMVIRLEAKHRRATASLLLGKTLGKFVFTTMGELTVETQPQHAIDQ